MVTAVEAGSGTMARTGSSPGNCTSPLNRGAAGGRNRTALEAAAAEDGGGCDGGGELVFFDRAATIYTSQHTANTEITHQPPNTTQHTPIHVLH